jgi:GMP synthase-like glutamine amidotransferase
MIVYVDTEHERVLNNPGRRNGHLSSQMDLKLKFEEISGVPCLVQRYRDVSLDGFHRMGVKAMIISGNATDWPEYDVQAFDRLNAIIRAAEIPILGVCGGLQVIGMAHGVGIKAMRKLHPGESDPNNLLAPGYFKEVGFMPIKVVKDDPIFAGIGAEPHIMASHFKELDRVPAGFELLASSGECTIQVIKRVDKPIYGFQLHPEAYTEGPEDSRSGLVSRVYPRGHGQTRPDGRTILDNFFGLKK